MVESPYDDQPMADMEMSVTVRVDWEDLEVLRVGGTIEVPISLNKLLRLEGIVGVSENREGVEDGA